MVKLKILAVIFIGLILTTSSGYAQTKIAPKVQDKKSEGEKTSTAEKKLPKDVPVVPLTNARIIYDHIVFDFGYVPPGSKVTHSFPVKNTGPDTLYITSIKAG